MKKLRRRRFLAGIAGASVALPFLESVAFETPGLAKAATDTPTFSMFFKQGNGVQQASGSEPDRFWPSETGPLTRDILMTRDGDRAVSELADYADQLLIVAGTTMPFSGGSCGHARGLAQVLTARQWLVGDRHARAGGESVDWLIGRYCNAEGVEPLNLAAGPVEGNYVSGNPSYSGPDQLRPVQNNPAAVYAGLFGDGGGEFADQIGARRRSVNDLIRAEMSELLGSPQLGAADRQRLQSHFEFIRDVEVRMSCELPADEVAAMEGIRSNLNANDERVNIMRMMMDLTALTFACDQNRSAVLQMGAGNDSTRYYVDGIQQNTYHRISHRIDDDGSNGPPIPNADRLHHQIDRIHAQMFKHFLDRVSTYMGPSGDTLLHDCVAVWMNDLSKGPPHSLDNMPWVVAGSGGGYLKQGEYVNVGDKPHNMFLNTLISANGITGDDGGPYTSFGEDSLEQGILAQLIA
ncbi:MAG: hypothetical protein ACI9KE_006659 [Polyangiales bacterium]|jgi:hypothetical protein